MKKWFPVLILLLITLALPMAANAAAKSGTCGDNITWTLNDSGVLTITGSGKMDNYNPFQSSPWGTAVKQAKINSGITSIGDWAFADCEEIEQIIGLEK